MTPAKDILGRTISVEDYVMFYDQLYQVLQVGQNNAKIILIEKAKTTKAVSKPGNKMCILPKDDVLLHLLKK